MRETACYGEKQHGEQTHYLSPSLALRCVELQAQQSSSDHAEPVDVNHILCILALMAKNTATHNTQRQHQFNMLASLTVISHKSPKLYQKTELHSNNYHHNSLNNMRLFISTEIGFFW